ncbi:prepilin peptidase [Candidatus Micrarchaeota archaeon]|nr:prepilin peptidase [Candidatus Micrarchaeota archaeon]
MQTIIPAALAIVALAAASWFDLRSRHIPDRLSLSVALAGLFLGALESARAQSPLPLLVAVITGLACFIFAYSLYSARVWGGGDAKLFAALGFLLPAFQGFWPVPFYALAASLLASVPFVILFSLFHLTANRQMRKHVAERLRAGASRAVLLPFHAVASLQAMAMVGVHAIFALPLILVLHKSRGYGIAVSLGLSFASLAANPIPFGVAMVSLLAASTLFLSSRACFSGLKKYALRREVAARSLGEGMILASDRKVGGRVVRAMARGLTLQEVSLLRKAGKKVGVRVSLPFTPIFTAGYALFLAAALIV